MSLFSELKRRNVFRVAVFYVVTAWVVIQVAETFSPIFGVPDWTLRVVIFLLALGFIPAVIFSWLYELTPDGIRKEQEVDRSRSVTHATARRVDIFTMVVVLLGIAVLVADRTLLAPPATPESQSYSESKEAVSVVNPGIKTIAVLPFVNMSAVEDNEFFSDGIAEELLNVLVKVKGLQVASRTSAFSFKGKDVDIPTVASALNVQHVVEGSVRRSGDQVRITAQLIDVRSDSHLWSDTYTRELKDVFAIQDEIATAIAQALSVELLGVRGQVIATHETNSVQAFENYLLGRHFFHQRTGDSLRKAIELFEEVIAADPNYARAYSGLADSYMLIFQYSDYPFRQAMERAVNAAEKAIELDPQLGEAYASLGLAAQIRREGPATVEPLFFRAIELNPGYSMAYMWLGNHFTSQRKIRSALEAFRKAESVDPLHPIIAENIGDTLLIMGRYEEATSHLSAALQVHPSNTVLMVRLADAHASQGDLVTAHRWLRRARQLEPGYPFALEELIVLETILGRFEAADHLISQMGAQFPNNPSTTLLRINWLASQSKFAEALEVVHPLLNGRRGLLDRFLRQFHARILLYSGDLAGALDTSKQSDPETLSGYGLAALITLADNALMVHLDRQAEAVIERIRQGVEKVRVAHNGGDESHELNLIEGALLALQGNPEEGFAKIQSAYAAGARWSDFSSPRPLLDKVMQNVPGYAELMAAQESDLARQRLAIESELDTE